MTPIFSILHPSARPHKWKEIYESWMGACDQPQFIEYVLCADERWGFFRSDIADQVRSILAGHHHPIRFESVWNTRRRCYVDAVNTAAEASSGRILIVIADDQYPCERWNERIWHALSFGVDEGAKESLDNGRDFVISVSTGTPHEHERGIMPMPILSRVRYERKGYVFFPEYESAYADNDFYAEAERDGVIIDARRLMFPHRHPLTEPGAWDKRADMDWVNRDEAYAEQNRPEAYGLGHSIFMRRFGYKVTSPQDDRSSIAIPIRDGFTGNNIPSVRTTPRSLALALPGESFHHVWVAKFAELVVDLMRTGWNYAPLFNYTSEPGITRATIVKAILEMREKGQFNPEFILWVDDDQIVEPQQVRMLIGDADQFPGVDLFAGWTWIASGGPHVNAPQVSCGRMDMEKGELSHAEYKSVQSAGGVFEVGWTGFPLVLMRTSALDKVGKHPFSHWPCANSPWGECGEDISFCKRLTDAGGKIYVDSRVFVPHLKLKALGPVPDSKEEISMALTGAMAAD